MNRFFNFLIVILVIILVVSAIPGCKSILLKEKAPKGNVNNFEKMTAEDIVNALYDAGFPLDNITDYTEQTDPNSLMNKDGEYTSKCSAADSRVDQSQHTRPAGISVEVFENNADAKARKKYIDNFGKNSPGFNEMSYIQGRVLLRVNHLLTASEGKVYRNALTDLANGKQPTFSK